MKTKKIKFKEGDLFAVPLQQGGYVIGLAARDNKGITLGYFFNLVYASLPVEVKGDVISKDNVIFIGKFSAQGIEKGEWPLINTDFIFNRDEWPIPVFQMQHPLTEKYFAVIYDETLVNEKRYAITEQEASKLFGDGLHGYGVIETKLSRLLAVTPASNVARIT